MIDDVSCQTKKMDSLRAQGTEKPSASISPCKSESHDVAEPTERDPTCHVDGEQRESPPESDLPSNSLIGE